MQLVLPRLYVILDTALLTTPPHESARSLVAAGVRLLQYRDKSVPSGELLRTARELNSAIIPSGASLIVNDRPEVAVLAGSAGVHVGQDDLSADQARAIVGDGKWVGVSTHNLEQFRAAASSSADYIAVGPVFSTKSKSNPGPVVGLELIRAVRPLTAKPVVAIGGITLDTVASVIEAGADSVAVISDILRASDPILRARRYIELLGESQPGTPNERRLVN